jgi:hypothetical protein
MADFKIRSIAEIEDALKGAVTFEQLIEAAIVLTGMGAFAPVQDAAIIAKARKRTEKLNHHLMVSARSSGDIAYLASPVTGGGVYVDRFNQLFCYALKQGRKTPADWANFVYQWLSAQGQMLLKDGRILETEEENRAELMRQAEEFNTGLLPVLKALEIV